MYVPVVDRGLEFVLDCFLSAALAAEELLSCSAEWIKTLYNKCMLTV